MRRIVIVGLVGFVLIAVISQAFTLHLDYSERGFNSLRVACVGDSITFGSHSTDPNRFSYPAVLQDILGLRFRVENFGVSGATATRGYNKSYTDLGAFEESLNFFPELVVLGLGTNDAKEFDERRFIRDYKRIINTYCNISTNPQVWVFTPPPLYKDKVLRMSQSVINEIFPTLIPRIVQETCANGIDIFSTMGGAQLQHPELIDDYCHPNDAGYQLMAKTISQAIGVSEL